MKIIIDVADTCETCFYFRKGICELFPDESGKQCLDRQIEVGDLNKIIDSLNGDVSRYDYNVQNGYCEFDEEYLNQLKQAIKILEIIQGQIKEG